MLQGPETGNQGSEPSGGQQARTRRVCACSDGVVAAVPFSASPVSSGMTQKWRHIEDGTVTSGHGFLFSVHGSIGFCSSAKKLY